MFLKMSFCDIRRVFPDRITNELELYLWVTTYVFNWIREPHGDWASSPFSYPELLAYLMFVYHIMLCTFIYCDFFVFAITDDDFYYYECYCTLCYMYLQVIRINIIIIIIII